MLPDSGKLRVVKAELERGLRPTRPAFLKWCCDKLSALPTQSATGMNAALWTDNVIDVCGEFPEDVLQTVTLDLLRGCTFRPSPSEIFKAADAKRGLRQRMLDRVNLMLRGGRPDQDAPAEKPIETRLGRMEHTRSIYARMNRRLDVDRIDREIAAEKGEQLPPVAKAEPATNMREEIREILARPMTADQRRVAEARKQATLRELGAEAQLPIPDAIPE